MMAGMDISDVAERLAAIGLCEVGRSGKSRSTYWAITRDDDQPRLRLSDHAVAYQSSDCAVCVGDAPDDDYRPDQWADAVRALWAAQLEHDAEGARSQADLDDTDPDAEAAEAVASMRRHVVQHNPRLAAFLGLAE